MKPQLVHMILVAQQQFQIIKNKNALLLDILEDQINVILWLLQYWIQAIVMLFIKKTKQLF